MFNDSLKLGDIRLGWDGVGGNIKNTSLSQTHIFIMF